MADVQTSEVDVKLESVNMGQQHFFSFAERPSEDEQLLSHHFWRNQKYEIRWLKIKIHILFYADNS
jgi:hypothetical protein